MVPASARTTPSSPPARASCSSRRPPAAAGFPFSRPSSALPFGAVLRRALLLVFLILVCAPAARADVPVLGEPQPIGRAGGPPLVSMGPQGDARVAWAASGGIWAALRSGP